MQIQQTRAARALIIAGSSGAVIVGAGCQSYEPKPLDLSAHRTAWHARTPDDEAVRTFAARLDRADDAAVTRLDPADGLSLAEGEIVALVYNPDLRLARLRAGVATATAEHAGLWDDPVFALDLLGITESIPDPWVVTPSLVFTIPISGRLAVEKARANSAMRAELDRVAESEWQVRHDVRRAWTAWSAERLRALETERLVTSMDSLVQSTARLAEAGEMVRTEAALFAIEQLQRRYELRRLEGAVAESEQRLRGLLGLAPEAPVTFVPTFDIAAPDVTGPDAVAERNPTLTRLREEYDVAEHALHREIRKQYPDLTIGPAYEFDQGQSRVGFFGAIPVPVLNANKQGIAEAEAERELARAAFETQYERLVGALAASRVRYETLHGQREQITAELAPIVDDQLADARRLLELGEGSGLVLLESLVRAHGTKMQLVDVRLGEAQATAELAFLAGPRPAPRRPENETATAPGREVTP